MKNQTTLTDSIDIIQKRIDNIQEETQKQLQRDNELVSLLKVIRSHFPEAYNYSPHVTYAVAGIRLPAVSSITDAIRVAIDSKPIDINLVQSACTSFVPMATKLEHEGGVTQVSPFYIEVRTLRGYPNETDLYFFAHCGEHVVKVQVPVTGHQKLGCQYSVQGVKGGHEIRDYFVRNDMSVHFKYIKWWASEGQPSNLTFYLTDPSEWEALLEE